MAGAAYEFDWGDLLIVYRHLEYDQDAASLLQDFSFSGPTFGARFHFEELGICQSENCIGPLL
jgi:hypothetical protein